LNVHSTMSLQYRYNHGGRTIAENLAQTNNEKVEITKNERVEITHNDNDIHIPSCIDTIIGYLLNALSDRDTIVRCVCVCVCVCTLLFIQSAQMVECKGYRTCVQSSTTSVFN
jgi:hypothetical protein